MFGATSLRSGAAAGALAVLAACAVTPLTNKLRPGEEPLVIGVGEGTDGDTDLYAASAAGGRFVRLTFSRPAERLPQLAPNGKAVAFLRARSAADSAAFDLVVLDLLTALERRTAVPAEAIQPEALGWSTAGDRVFLRAGALFGSPAPPADLRLEPVGDVGAALADSATRILLGDPPFAEATRCPGHPCLVTASGDTTHLDSEVIAVFRWGGDSLAVVTETEEVRIRPLRGGRVRVPRWTDAPRGLRALTYHPGGDSVSAAPR